MPQADWTPTEKQSLIVAYQTASPPPEVVLMPDPPHLAESEGGILGPEPRPGCSSPAPLDLGWPSLA